MGVELLIHRKGAREPDYFSITGATGWKTVWLPAAAELEVDLIPRLGDGSFTDVTREDLPAVVEQLTRLRIWMESKGQTLYVEHLDDILRALAAVHPGDDQISFG